MTHKIIYTLANLILLVITVAGIIFLYEETICLTGYHFHK